MAKADNKLWQSSLSFQSQDIPREIYSLPPSDDAITLSYLEIAKLLPEKIAPKNLIVTQTPNHVAIVLVVKIGDLVLLLGSDLEETGHPGTGWSVIVDSTTRPSDAAGFYKVPHHGSRNADYPSTWTDMLQTEPMAALTPFVRGNVKLPTENDVNRICSRTPKAYATAVPRQRQVRGRSNTVDRTIRETVRWIGEVYTSQGQIRLRKKILASGENDWHVKLFGDALPLRDMYKGS